MRGGNGINAFLLLKACNNPRLDNTDIQMLKSLEDQISGGNSLSKKLFWEHVIIVITRVDGHELKKCNKEYLNELRLSIIDELNLHEYNINLPIIGMSNEDNFQKPIQNLIENVIPKSKYYSVTLHSPLMQLNAKKVQIKNELDKYKGLYENSVTGVRTLDNAIQSMINQLNNKVSNDEKFWLNYESPTSNFEESDILTGEIIEKYSIRELRSCHYCKKRAHVRKNISICPHVNKAGAFFSHILGFFKSEL